jgi:prepilin-type processing-associated H-X9-DG protein
MASVRDGSSNVFLVGDSNLQQGDITFASSYKHGIGAVAYNVSACVEAINSLSSTSWSGVYSDVRRSFGSEHPGGCHFSLADGSVHFVSENIALDTYRSLGIRNDGAPLAGLSY